MNYRRNPESGISEAESRVMEVLWQHAPRSAEDVVRVLQPATSWHEKTIKTLLNRLLRKGAVAAARDGRRYLYTPRLQRQQWQASESRDLLQRVFGGRLSPLLAQFRQQERFDPDDIAELRLLLEQIESRERKP